MSILLREKIQKIVKASEGDIETAERICVLLEEEMDLAGNGWFDGDPLFEDNSQKYQQISDKVREILQKD